MKNSLLVLGLALILSSCHWFSPKKDTDKNKVIIAQVGDEMLYEEDLSRLLGENATRDDSITVVGKYVNNWVRKHLLIREAKQIITFDEAELERKVEDYRSALVIHEFEKLKVNEQLSKEVSKEEIKQYYEEKYENFLLRQNIIKCIFAKIPEDAPGINTFSRDLRKYPKSGNLKDIKSFCFQFADKYSVEDSTWINFDDIIQNTHLASIPNKVQYLKSNKYVESTNEGYVFFLKILDYKISDDISPLSFIEAEIENIIINKRKVEIKKNLEEQIFNKAKSKNEFEIFKK